MAYSSYFQPAPIFIGDDDGVYYLRQLDSRDGVGFEGLIWFGQTLQREPLWANVFAGRLRRGVREDERGNPVDQWEGVFFDVPKGRLCGRGPITLESFVVPPNPRGGCDFPENYLVRVAGSGFGGATWNVQSLISGCWADNPDLPAPPDLPPIFSETIRADPRGVDELVAGLQSGGLAPGFTQSANLTGEWVGDDSGTYYLREVPETNDVVWYAESPNAMPQVRRPTEIRPAQGWSHVFIGKSSGDLIEGFWADVPRGATRNSGPMRLRQESGHYLEIVDVAGGFGGRRLWRVDALDVTVRVPRLTIENSQEGRDEPLLYLCFFKIDGETVDLDDLSSSRATLFNPASTLVGDDITGTNPVDPRNSTFETRLKTVRTRLDGDVEASTLVGVIGYAIEVDEGYDNDFRRRRLLAWRESQEGFLNRQLAAGVIPETAATRTNAQRILTRYLGPWEGWPWGDPDDILSGDVAVASFSELRASLRGGAPLLSRQMTFRGSGSQYRADVEFVIASRLNGRCSS